MMLDAVYRRAPFQAGEKEKGFRDALVMEAFAQLIEASPTTPEAARILLVTGDQLLREAVHARARDAKNVAVFGSLDELGNLINTLGATVDEDHLKVVREKAAALFYKHDGKSTLYYKANLVTKMQDAVAKFIQLPAGAESYRIDNWHLGLTGFLRKEHQVYTWSTRLEAHLTATKAVIPKVGAYYPLSLGDVSKGSLLAPALESFDFPLVSGVVYPSGTLPYSPPWVASEEAVTTGIASVDVVWTATITADGQLRKPTFLSVVPVDTVWK